MAGAMEGWCGLFVVHGVYRGAPSNVTCLGSMKAGTSAATAGIEYRMEAASVDLRSNFTSLKPGFDVS